MNSETLAIKTEREVADENSRKGVRIIPILDFSILIELFAVLKAVH